MKKEAPSLKFERKVASTSGPVYKYKGLGTYRVRVARAT
jgi:hypothetical protein